MTERAKKEWTPMLITACIVVTASASFSFGYGIGAPNMYTYFTEPFLRSEYDICDVGNDLVRQQNNCSSSPSFIHLTNSIKKEIINGLPQTIFTIGCFAGSLTGGMWYNAGSWATRRTVFFINLPIMYLASAFVLISYYLKINSLYYLSRLLHGYQGGMACCIVPPYLNEISPQSVRGSTGVLHQFFITVGIFIGQLLGLPPILGRFDTWSIGLAVVAIPCLLGNVAICFIPESPSEMLLKFKNKQKALKNIFRLRSSKTKAKNELDELEISLNQSSVKASTGMRELLMSKELRWPLITSSTILIMQALSGINAVFFYSSKIFETAGVKESQLPYASTITGLINVIITISAIPLIERLGRKPLIIYPVISMLTLFILLTTFIQLNEKHKSQTIGYVCVALTLLFICAFAVGLGPIAFVYPNEVFRMEMRDTALRIGLCLNYIGNLFLSLCFPVINSVLRGYVFLIFFCVLLIGLIILWRKMPETKNKSVQEVERYWGIYAKENEHQQLMVDRNK